ncbi:MAG: response regulator [Planctomycetaceae bacterium]
MRILVVDDDPISQRILTSYLGKWGYECAVASDGEQAWRMLQQHDYPIVISDWLMPGLDGLELIRRIRHWDTPHGHVYTILLTAKSDKEDLVCAMDAGADDFIAKPFDRDELRVRIREGANMVHRDRQVAARANDVVARLEELRTLLHTPAADPVMLLAQADAAVAAACDAARGLAREVHPGDGAA